MAPKLALIAALVLVLAVGASAGYGPKVLRLRVAYKAGETTGTPGYPTAVTSYSTFAGSVYDWKTSKFLGFSDGVVTVLKVGSSFTILDARFTYVFPGVGTISTAGYIDTSLSTNTIAATGGTGAYVKANGYVTSQDVPSYRFKFKDSVVEIDVTIYL